ncbi:MAG: hypothetical protein E7058_07170 [Lentisphaerae bacterium]|nr:hypothetical protein [Lentisphaerota bacterium]
MTAQSAYQLLFVRSGTTGEPVMPEDLLLRRIGSIVDRSAPVSRLLNTLVRETDAEQLAAAFMGELFNSLVSFGVLPQELAAENFSDDTVFLLENALTLHRFLHDLLSTVPPEEAALLLPSAGKLFDKFPDFNGDIRNFAAALSAADLFNGSRVFSWHRGRFFAVQPSSAKSVDKFFGYPGVQVALREQFTDFARGKTNLPLLINSLPGYGKTSMVISFALAVPGTVVILADPETLESSWQQLITLLGKRPDRRFVLFFDDIDPRNIDWYNFRTNVGGAFSPPENIMPVLTANYEFPPSILSRGRRISYPVFDEERCSEMIEDFLISFGMKKPPRNIVSLMGAEYTEEFGQKKFTELSPRTLMRHLAAYEHDPRKRKQIVELAGGGMITKPDAELFYEFNIELMRSLYGEEYIQRLLKERLRSL